MKKNPIRIVIIAGILFIFSFLINSQDSQIEQNKSFNTSNLKVKIDLANPKAYYQNDEIEINVKIFNDSNNHSVFIIAMDKRYSFDFQLVTIQNRSIEHSYDYVSSFHRIQSVFTSSVRLEAGEGYVFKARLNDYFDLNQPGQYYIKCNFFPELKLNNTLENTIISNQLSINIRPAKIDVDQYEGIIDQTTTGKDKESYIMMKIPPDEVIDFMLKARINKQWDKFFLYLNLEQLILTNSNFRQRFYRADAETKKQIIKEYKEYLKRDSIDDISFMPTDFEILKTEYMSGKAKVDVLETFKYQKYEEKKYYTYFLNKEDNIWFVVSYEVLNIK